MPFAIVIRRRGSLWRLIALYNDKRGQVVVSVSWHRTRDDAARDAGFFI